MPDYINTLLEFLKVIGPIAAALIGWLTYRQGKDIKIHINSKMDAMLALKDEVKAAAVDAMRTSTQLEERTNPMVIAPTPVVINAPRV